MARECFEQQNRHRTDEGNQEATKEIIRVITEDIEWTIINRKNNNTDARDTAQHSAVQFESHVSTCCLSLLTPS
jgi:E3 ubiquitin-protein ligase DOA10